MHLLYRSNNFWKTPWKSPCVSVPMTFVTASVTRIELWTGVLSWWKCHWPDLKSVGLFQPNLSLNSLKPQHSNPKPNSLANQLWCIDFLTPPHLSSSLTDSLPSLNLLCHSKTDAPFMQEGRKAIWSIPYVSVSFFPSLNTILLHIVVPHVQIAFLKFTSCDNQALVGCIPIPSVAVYLNLKS